MPETSTKPYMIRALYAWCCDNGYTPYLAVAVDRHTRVPRQHVKAGEIVLNVSPMATNRLQLGNEQIEFQARFSGVAHEISIPVQNVSAIYARETGHGMAFEVPKAPANVDDDGAGSDLQGIDSAMPESAGVDADSDGQRSPTAGERSRAARSSRRRGPRAVDSTSGAGGTVTTLQQRGGAIEGSSGGAEVIAFASPGASRRRRDESDTAAAETAETESGIPDAGDGAGAGNAHGPVGEARVAAHAVPLDGAASDARSSPAPIAPAPAAEPAARQGDRPEGDDPPPEGGGKNGKARLTRVK